MGQRVVKSTEGKQTRVRHRDLIAIRRIVIAAIEEAIFPKKLQRLLIVGDRLSTDGLLLTGTMEMSCTK